MPQIFSSSLIAAVNEPLDAKIIAADITSRDAIPPSQRYRGMQVTVQNAGAVPTVIYWLPTDDLTNTGWALLDTGGGGGSYVHTQTIPAATWNITHSLGSLGVSAVVIDSTGDEIIGWLNRAASTVNLLVIQFSEPLAGVAYIKA